MASTGLAVYKYATVCDLFAAAVNGFLLENDTRESDPTSPTDSTSSHVRDTDSNDNSVDLLTGSHAHLTATPPLCTDDLQVDKNMTLHRACQDGELCVVQYILTRGLEDINTRGFMGRTPVMMAALSGQREVFDFLVSQKCDLSGTDVRDNNALHLACKGGNIDIVQTLIADDKFDYEDRGWNGMTPVMYAAWMGHGKVFDFLVSRECDLSCIDTYGNTILHLACGGGNAKIVETLIVEEQLYIEVKGYNEMTPVMSAVYGGRKLVFDLLVSKGCNLKAKDKKEMSILHYACWGGQVDIVEYIISHNIADMEIGNYYGETPVMVAVQCDHIQLVNLLLKRGCSPAALDVHGNNILHLACREGFVDMVNCILEKDIVDIEERNKKDRTPLLIAAARGHKEAFDALVSEGCDMRVRDYRGNNILHVACTGGCVGIVKYILTQNVVSIESRNSNGRTPLLIAAASGHTRVVEILVNYGCNHSAQDHDKNNILHVASIGGHCKVVEYILTMKLVDIDSKGYRGRTPVMHAAMHGQRGVVRVLLRKGCNPTTLDDHKNNILHLACLSGHYKIVKYILRKHIIGIDSRGMNDRTPVMLAVLKKEHKKVVQLLVNQGCDLKAVDDAGNSVLHLACSRDHVEMVSYIIRHGDVDYKQKNKRGMTPMQVAKAKHLTSMAYLLKAGE